MLFVSRTFCLRKQIGAKGTHDISVGFQKRYNSSNLDVHKVGSWPMWLM